MQTKSKRSELFDQIGINFAFEQMILAVLTGAAIGGGAALAINLLEAALGRGLTFQIFLSGLMGSLLVSFLIFLIGFFASVIIGAPLFRALEKAKRRTAWPYLSVALAVAFISVLFIYHGFPTMKEFWLKALTEIFLPTIVIALTFAQRMRPYWRAAERAEEDVVNLRLIH